MGIESFLDTPFAEAVRIAGGQSKFSRLVKRPQQTVFDALKAGRPLWPEDVLIVERATGVSRHRLRPDVYGPEPEDRAA